MHHESLSIAQTSPRSDPANLFSNGAIIARVIHLHSGSVSVTNHSLHVLHSACDGLILRGAEEIHCTLYVVIACAFEVCWERHAADGLLIDASCEANALVHLHTTQNAGWQIPQAQHANRTS